MENVKFSQELRLGLFLKESLENSFSQYAVFVFECGRESSDHCTVKEKQAGKTIPLLQSDRQVADSFRGGNAYHHQIDH